MDTNFLPPYQIHEILDNFALSQTIGWGLKDLNIPDLWQETRGEGVTIAVIDTGYVNHFELKHSIKTHLCRSFVPNEDIDLNGHSTMVCGVISAKDDNNGVVGVAPLSELVTIKAIPDAGSFSDMTLLNNSLEYALSINPDIVNLSLGGYQRYGGYTESLIQEFYNRNIPFVCASGNRADKPVTYPANYEHSIGVTSFKKGRLISDFSPSGENIDFALPGDQIITTALDDKYAVVSGSSFAAPFMSGIIALLISSWKKRNMPYTVDSIMEKLRTKCIKVDNNDKHSQFGYGIINMKDLN